jgi:hypothetical protein
MSEHDSALEAIDSKDDKTAKWQPLSQQEFIQLIYKEFNVFNTWFHELLCNVLDERVVFADKYDFLDRMLPRELPRPWIKRLCGIKGEIKTNKDL